MGDRIEKRRNFAGTGMMSQPEYLEQLQERRDLHARLIAGKPERTFAAVLHEKMHGPPAPPAEEPPREAGAIEPHMGLSPSQDVGLVTSGKGRRSGRVIVKG